MAIAKQNMFPKPLHGMLVIFLGVAIAIMGPFGWLGGIHGREGDLDAAIFFFLGGGCFVLIGFALTVRSVRHALRSS
jgi:hypothetical protein